MDPINPPVEIAESVICAYFIRRFLMVSALPGIPLVTIPDETALTCVGGIFSTLLLALNLYFKDFNLNADITRHSTVANALWSIRESYVSLLTDFPNMTNAEICNRRDELQTMTAEVYKSAPKTDSKAYAMTQKALKTEEEQFFGENELDMILPPHLRSNK